MSSNSASASNSNSAGASGSNSGSSTLDIPATAPAGALSVTSPVPTSTAFFKIASGELVTFAWSLSDVIATPTSLTIHAVGDNGNSYPVGPTDGIIPGADASVVWDPYGWNEANPTLKLAQATYSLEIWDDRGKGAPRRAGYMQPFNGLKFAFYTPQPYTPLASGWTCSGCSGAPSLRNAAHPTVIALITTFMIIFLSGFTILRGRR